MPVTQKEDLNESYIDEYVKLQELILKGGNRTNTGSLVYSSNTSGQTYITQLGETGLMNSLKEKLSPYIISAAEWNEIINVSSSTSMNYKGSLDCSTNPNYPAAGKGSTYNISVAGKIGGAAGINVEIGDLIICNTDSVAGTHVAVGTNWSIVQGNIDGAVTLTGTQTLTNKTLTSPNLTSTPTAPTAAANTNTTQIATTAFVLGQAGSASPLTLGASASVGTSTKFAREDHVHTNNLSFETSASNIKADGASASVGALSTIPRADHVHPSDSTKMGTSGGTFTGPITAPTISSSTPTGTAPFTVASTTMVTNLNVDYLEGQHGSFYNTQSITIALSDETTALTTGTAKVTFRAPFAMTLYQIPRAYVSIASTSGIPTVDIKKNTVSIFTTPLTIDINEKTSVTATTAAVMTATPLAVADDDEFTFDVTVAGTGTKGLKVTLYYRRT